MTIILAILFYIFAFIGYFFTGLFIYINFEDTIFNKLLFYFDKFLEKIFYKNNKEHCYYNDDNILFYEHNIYWESKIWNKHYKPYEMIFEFICLLCWPIWVLINLIIGAFYDD